MSGIVSTKSYIVWRREKNDKKYAYSESKVDKNQFFKESNPRYE
jgi:hypothetical protein